MTTPSTMEPALNPDQMCQVLFFVFVFCCVTYQSFFSSTKVIKETKVTRVHLVSLAWRDLLASEVPWVPKEAKARQVLQEMLVRSLTPPSQWDVASPCTVWTTTKPWCSTPCLSMSTSTSTCSRENSTVISQGSTSLTLTSTHGTLRRPTFI